MLLARMTYAEITFSNKSNRTAAQEAERKGHANIATLILDRAIALHKEVALNEFINVAKNGGWAAEEKMHAFVQEDIAVVNHKDSEGNTALIWAASKGREDAVLALVNKVGIDIQARNDKQDTALICAVRGGHAGVVSLLLAEMKLQDVNWANHLGITALREAELKGNKAIVTLIRNRQSVIRSAVASEEFFNAVKNGDLSIVQYYLQDQQKEVVNCTDQNGNTPLILAANKGHVAVVEFLLAQEGDILNSPNKWGNTALICAALGGHLAVIKVLLAKEGIDVARVDQNYDTALCWAAYNGHSEVVSALLRRMSIQQINFLNNYGRTAAQEAQRKGYFAIVGLIIEHLSVLHKEEVQLTPQQQLDATAFKGEVPVDLICPIAQDDCVMTDPITVSSGMTFERATLKAWCVQNLNHKTNTFLCPLTRIPLKPTELNNEISEFTKKAIERFVSKNTQKIVLEEKNSEEKAPLLIKESKKEHAVSTKKWYESYSSQFFSCIYKPKPSKATQLSPQQQLEAIHFKGIVPKYLVCPIAKDNKVMVDPVTISSGKTFERANLLAKSQETIDPRTKTFPCPETKRRISQDELNNAPTACVKHAVAEFVLEQKKNLGNNQEGKVAGVGLGF